jgi:type VI secretion system protein ImpH
MASKARPSTNFVTFLASLEEEAHRFDFFQVLRKLEAFHGDKPGLGRSSRPSEDSVRLTQEPTLRFAPAMLAGYEPGKNGVPDRLAENFFGLFGPNGPLPTHLTEYALQRKLNEDDPAFARFADLFHHRMLSFLYRAWADARPTVHFDRPLQDRFSTYVGSLFGMGTADLRDSDALSGRAKLHYAGVLALQTKSAEGLCAALEDFFQIQAGLAEFQGAWMILPDNCLLRLGTSRDTGRLGKNAVLGAKVWGCQQKFRIVFGPLNIESLSRMLPGKNSIRRLVALVRCYAGDEKDWDVQFVLNGKDVPTLELGKSGQLGWTTWLNTEQERLESVDDVVLNPMLFKGAFDGVSQFHVEENDSVL